MEESLFWIVGFFILFVWPLVIAASKGRSVIGVFLVSLFFTPLGGLLVALLMERHTSRFLK